MSTEFLNKLIKKFPNYYQLGELVKTYWQLSQTDMPVKEIEKKILRTTFSNN